MTNPSAGWYATADQPGTLRWWDGAAWTDHRHPAPTDWDRQPGRGTRPGVTAAGAALAIDGVAGIGRRGGIGAAISIVFTGIGILAIAAFVLAVGIWQATTSAGVPGPGAAIPGAVIIGVAGVLTVAFGLWRTTLRAGSIVAGVALIIHGTKGEERLVSAPEPDASSGPVT